MTIKIELTKENNEIVYRQCMQFLGNCRLYNNWLAERYKEQELYNACDSEGKMYRKFKVFFPQERRCFQKHHKNWRNISNERFSDIEDLFKASVINNFYNEGFPYYKIDPCLMRKKDEQWEFDLELQTVKNLGLYTEIKKRYDVSDDKFEHNCLYREPDGFLEFSVED